MGRFSPLGMKIVKRVVTVCEDCSKKLGETRSSEVIEKYGHVDEKAFERGIKFEKNIAS
ncbi:MAG: hypothetical protein QW040_00135 [Candidatus Aenigmatarchaeota archaeon]